MKEDKKIPIETIKKRLQFIMGYKNPEIAFRALLLCWMNHPRYKSPLQCSVRRRLKEDGFMWLKQEEIISFSDYCGYNLS